jgi:hypothetical protein
VKETTALLQRCISSRIEVACATDSQPLPVKVDAVWLRRVLLILAILAAKRIAEAGTVTLQTSGGSEATVVFKIGVLADRPPVTQRDDEGAALGEAERFAIAHGGKLNTTGTEIVLTAALDDLT